MTFDHLLAQLQDNYNREIDDDQARNYQRELGHIPYDVLQEAIRHAIRNRKYLPNVFELLEDVAAVRNGNPSLQRSFESCGACNAGGWISVEGREQQVLIGLDANGKRVLPLSKHAVTRITETVRGSSESKRCECYLKWRRSQGLPDLAPTPSVHIDKDRAIGATSNWNSPSQLAATNSKVARFKKRIS